MDKALDSNDDETILSTGMDIEKKRNKNDIFL